MGFFKWIGSFDAPPWVAPFAAFTGVAVLVAWLIGLIGLLTEGYLTLGLLVACGPFVCGWTAAYLIYRSEKE